MTGIGVNPLHHCVNVFDQPHAGICLRRGLPRRTAPKDGRGSPIRGRVLLLGRMTVPITWMMPVPAGRWRVSTLPSFRNRVGFGWIVQVNQPDRLISYPGSADHEPAGNSIPGRGMKTMPDVIVVNDSMQQNYQYRTTALAGRYFDAGFSPFYTPREMLEMGVFEGKYCNDCRDELPRDWFLDARISAEPDPELNYFGLKSRQPLSVWRQKGWIYGPDPRGWFQWYCRYFLGRRLPEIDPIQIRRWRAFARHAGQIRANCDPGDIFCRKRQRQALLQWSHDPLI